jgi:hypothetical protein
MRSLLLGLASFFLLISAANAQSWTAAASACVVDESALSIYQATTANVGYLSTSTSTSFIVVRCNVTCQGDDTPAWTNFEMLANNDNVTNGVIATLYSIGRTTGTLTTVATISSTASSSTTTYTTSVSGLNCSNNYYVVEAILGRPSSSNHPLLYGVRLY